MTSRRNPAKDSPTTPRFRVIEGEALETDVRNRVHKLKESFLECRTIGHAWKMSYIGPAGRADEELQGRARNHPGRPDGARVLKCGRCRTERVDLAWIGYGRNEYDFRLVARYYRYPDDYKVEGAQDFRYLLQRELFLRGDN